MDQEIKNAGYENIVVDCPLCEFENTYNRISDLKTIRAIPRMDGIVCENEKCKAEFSIIGDHVKFAKFCWFIDDLPIFKKNKQYGQYILNLCQGLECFFGEAIINKKFDRNPAYRDEYGHLMFIEYQRDKKMFMKNCFRKMAFNDLRTFFLDIYKTELSKPTSRIKEMKENRLNESVIIVRKTDINQTRNKVIHKEAYRPNLDEIEKYYDLVKAIYWLRGYLMVSESSYLANTNINDHL